MLCVSAFALFYIRFIYTFEIAAIALPALLLLSICIFLREFTIFYLYAVVKVLWWAQVDSNHRPRAYQARALTS